MKKLRILLHTFLDHLSMSQRFILFYCLLLAGPMLLLGWLSYGLVNAHHDQRMERSHRTETSIVRYALNQYVDQVKIHIASAWAKADAKDLSSTLRNASPAALAQYYRKELGNHLVWVTDNSARIMPVQGPDPNYFPPDLNAKVIQDIQPGTVLTYLDDLTQINGDNKVMAMVSVHRVGPDSPYSVISANIIDFKDLFQSLSVMQNSMVLRVYAGDSGHRVLYQSSLNDAMFIQSAPIWHRFGIIPFINKYIYNVKVSDSERLNGQLYKRGEIPLTTRWGKQVGVLVVNSSLADIESFQIQRVGFFVICQSLIIILILFFGNAFKKTFISPVEDLSQVSQHVAHGDLTVRTDESKTHGELRDTLVNFNRMIDLLEEKERLRRNFIANLTHDFRTPLIAQERALELLLEEFSQSNLQELESLTNGLLKNNTHLIGMVNQLLEMYKFEAGQIKIVKASVNLPKLVSHCFEQINAIAAPKSIRLVSEIPDSLPLLQADRHSLSRVLLNLLGNALENIPKGSMITVSASIQDDSVEIRVTDNGPGIEPEELRHIFDRYFSGKNNQRKIGSGLGLYICRMLIDAHQGKIEVESEVGKFTSFKIRLPLNVHTTEELSDVHAARGEAGSPTTASENPDR